MVIVTERGIGWLHKGGSITEAVGRDQKAPGLGDWSGPFPGCVSSQSPSLFPSQRRAVSSFANSQGSAEVHFQKEIMGKCPEKSGKSLHKVRAVRCSGPRRETEDCDRHRAVAWRDIRGEV